MSDYAQLKVTKDYREIVNTKTGVVRRIPFASDKQFSYIQSLRADLGKPPLKHRPPAYQASKIIDKLLERKKKLDVTTTQQRLI